jgi:hypothetical protein
VSEKKSEPIVPPEKTSSNPDLAAPSTKPLSQDLAEIMEAFREHPVKVREVVAHLKGRAFLFLLLMLSLPFCTPIPPPGLAIAFGLAIALIGLRLALRQEPWLPEKFLNLELPAKFLPRVFAAARQIVLAIEYLLQPRQRLSSLVDPGPLHHVYGAMICICGLLLSLPLPIPLTNLVPSLTIIVLVFAMVARDGVSAIIGSVMFVVTTILFSLIGVVGVAGITAAWAFVFHYVTGR